MSFDLQMLSGCIYYLGNTVCFHAENLICLSPIQVGLKEHKSYLQMLLKLDKMRRLSEFRVQIRSSRTEASVTLQKIATTEVIFLLCFL